MYRNARKPAPPGANAGYGCPEYPYPRRALLGFTDADRELIRDRLLAHLPPKFSGYR
jgi:hypothetical protein